MKSLLILVFFAFLSAGCAEIKPYDPLHASQNETLLLNESALKAVHVGMTEAQVHGIMGQTIIIGYAAQSQIKPSTYDPLTIPNPYKIEKVSAGGADYLVEYYVSAVHQPDGKVSDDEMEPLVFKGGQLAGRGWDFLNALRPRP